MGKRKTQQKQNDLHGTIISTERRRGAKTALWSQMRSGVRPKMMTKEGMMLQNRAEMESNDAQEAPRLHPDGPRGFQMGSDSSKAGPRSPQDLHKTCQDGPGRPQDGSKGSQDGSKMDPRGRMMDPRGHKMDPKSVQEAS